MQIEVAVDKENLYLKLKFTSTDRSYLTIFLQGGTPGLKEHYKDVIKIGENPVIFKLNKKEIKNFNAGLAINLGEKDFIFYNKSLMDNIANR